MSEKEDLKQNLIYLSVQLDDSHTRYRMEWQSIDYQSKKISQRSPILCFLCDNLGQILAMGGPKSGNHHDLNNIDFILKEIVSLLEEVKIEHKGLFLNADAGIDSRDLRSFLQKKEIIFNSNKIPEMDKMKIFILMKNYKKLV